MGTLGALNGSTNAELSEQSSMNAAVIVAIVLLSSQVICNHKLSNFKSVLFTSFCNSRVVEMLVFQCN